MPTAPRSAPGSASRRSIVERICCHLTCLPAGSPLPSKNASQDKSQADQEVLGIHSLGHRSAVDGRGYQTQNGGQASDRQWGGFIMNRTGSLRRGILMVGSGITSDGGLLAYRELDDALGLTAKAVSALAEGRRGKNIPHWLLGLLRQAVHGPPRRLRRRQRRRAGQQVLQRPRHCGAVDHPSGEVRPIIIREVLDATETRGASVGMRFCAASATGL
jgi:hypothetical protein